MTLKHQSKDNQYFSGNYDQYNNQDEEPENKTFTNSLPKVSHKKNYSIQDSVIKHGSMRIQDNKRSMVEFINNND